MQHARNAACSAWATGCNSRMPPPTQQQDAQSQSIAIVYLQKLNRGATNGRPSRDGTVSRQGELLAPSGTTRMIEGHNRPRFGIN
jgi:hypothetical protein